MFYLGLREILTNNLEFFTYGADGQPIYTQTVAELVGEKPSHDSPARDAIHFIREHRFDLNFIGTSPQQALDHYKGSVD